MNSRTELFKNIRKIFDGSFLCQFLYGVGSGFQFLQSNSFSCPPVFGEEVVVFGCEGCSGLVVEVGEVVVDVVSWSGVVDDLHSVGEVPVLVGGVGRVFVVVVGFLVEVVLPQDLVSKLVFQGSPGLVDTGITSR